MNTKLRYSTLLILTKNINGKPSQVCLALKKRGFGKDRWNGVGGKPNGEDKSIEDTAIREAKEEINIIPKNLEKIAEMTFIFPLNAEWNQLVHVYKTDSWEGEPIETEEMRPQWFRINDIPFNQMWSDDKLWFPYFLNGKLFKARFVFGEGDKLTEQKIEEVDKL